LGRIYAGVLGPLAMLTMLARGLLAGGGGDTTLYAAWLGLLAFSAIGYVVGCAAGRAIEDSIRLQVETELAEAHGGRVPLGDRQG
jgi:hypothetical protein